MSNGLIYVLGAVLRYALSGVKYIEERPEISNPTNAWKRLIEGVYLNKQGLSPYDGVVFHESPLLLHLYSLFEPILVDYSTLACILLDLLTCYVLGLVGDRVAVNLLQKQKEDKDDCHPEASSVLISSNLVNTLPKHLAIFYLLNPYLVVSAAARTTTVWSNLLVSLALLGQVRGSRVLGSLALGLAAYQTLYPIILIFPFAIQIAQNEGGGFGPGGVEVCVADDVLRLRGSVRPAARVGGGLRVLDLPLLNLRLHSHRPGAHAQYGYLLVLFHGDV